MSPSSSVVGMRRGIPMVIRSHSMKSHMPPHLTHPPSTPPSHSTLHLPPPRRPFSFFLPSLLLHLLFLSLLLLLTPTSTFGGEVTQLELRLVTNLGTVSGSILDQFTPTFSVDQFTTYQFPQDLSYTNASCQFRITFTTLNGVAIYDSSGSTILSTDAIQTDVWTPLVNLTALSPTRNSIRLYSLVDQQSYIFQFTRSQPVLTDLSFASQTEAMDLLVPPTLTPPFTPGLMTYNILLHSSSTTCSVKTFTLSGNYTGIQMTLGTTTITSGFVGSIWTTAVKNNVLLIKIPTDGWITVNIYRYSGSFVITNLPTTLYANQATSPSLTFQPAITGVPVVTLTPNSTTPGVIFTPSVLTWSSASVVLSLVVTAPPTDTALSIVITYSYGGRDELLFNPIPPMTVQVKPQDSFILSNLPGSLYSNQWSPTPITLTPSVAPDNPGTGVRVYIYSTAGSDSVDPQTLYFEPGITTGQTFRIRGDNPSAGGILTVNFTFEASTASQFSLPSSFDTWIYPAGHLLVSGLGSAEDRPSINSGRSMSVGLTLDTIPLPDDGSAYVEVQLAALYGSFDRTTITITDLQTRYVTYTAPRFFLNASDATQNDTILLSFTSGVGDQPHFANPEPLNVSIISSAHLLFANAPIDVVIEGSFSFSILPSTSPLLIVVDGTITSTGTVTAVGSLGGEAASAVGSVIPTTGVTIDQTNVLIPQTVTYSAPSTARVVALYNGFTFTGSNAWQFANSPYTIPLVFTVRGTSSLQGLLSSLYTNQQVTLTARMVGMARGVTNCIFQFVNSLGSTTLMSSNSIDFSGAVSSSTTTSGALIFTRTVTLTAPSTVPIGKIQLNTSITGSNANLIYQPTPASFEFSVLPQSTINMTNLPTKLYAGQTSGAIAITFGEATTAGYTGDTALGITVRALPSGTASAGTVTAGLPATWNFPSGYSTPLSFTYTAGSTSGTVALSLVLTKDDAPHYALNPASYSVTILDRDVFTMSGMPGEKLAVSTTTTISVVLSKSPVIETGVYTGTVTLTAIVTTGTSTTGVTYSSVTPSVITFTTSNWNQPQTIQLVAQNIASTFTLSFAVSGSNAPQYVVPASTAITTFGIVTYPSVATSMYTSQVLDPIIFTPLGIGSGVRLQVSIYPLSLGSLTPVSGIYDLSSGAVSVVYTAPATLPSDFLGQVTLTFTLLGGVTPTGTVDQPITPSAVTINMLPRSSILVAGATLSTMLVSEDSGSLSFTPQSMPLLGGIVLDLTITLAPFNQALLDDALNNAIDDEQVALVRGCFFQGSYITGRVTQLTWQPDTTPTTQSIQFHAGSVAAVATLSFSYPANTNGINDNYHFGLPSSIVVTINPRATYQILHPLNVFRGQNATFMYMPSAVTQDITLTVTASVGTLNARNGVGAQQQLALQWTNATSQSVTYTPPTDGSTLCAFTYVSSGSDSNNLPNPLADSVSILNPGNWDISSIPAFVTFGSSWTFTIAPSVDITGSGGGNEIHLTLAVTGGGSIEPPIAAWTEKGQIISFVYTATVPGNFTVTFTQRMQGTVTTTLTAPDSFRIIVAAPITITPAVTGETIPTFLYANQLSNKLSLTPSSYASIIPSAGLTVTFTSDSSPVDAADVWRVTPPGATAQPTSLSFVNSGALQFNILAPPLNATYGALRTSFRCILSDLAAVYFSAPVTLTFQVLPQSQLSIVEVSDATLFVPITVGNVTTTRNLYAYSVVTWTVSQLAKSTTTAGAFTLTITIVGGAGTLDTSSFTFPVDKLSSFTFSFTAPVTLHTGMSLVFTASGSDAAHFAVPQPIIFNTLGPLLLAGCTSTTQNIMVTGTPDEQSIKTNATGIFAGMYLVDAPIRRMPHYILTRANGGGSTLQMHLFYMASADSPFSSSTGGVWVLDSDTTAGTGTAARHSKAIYTTSSISPLFEPTSATNDAAIKWYTASGVLVPGVLIACGLDCANIGQSTSLESNLCFGGQALATTTPVITTCPISCGHYVPAIVAACSIITTTWRPAVSTPLTAMQTKCAGTAAGDALPPSIGSVAINAAIYAASCSYARTLAITQACGITLSSGDSTWDLSNTMIFPTSCSTACNLEWSTYFTNCVSTAAPSTLQVNTPLMRFNALCLTATYQSAINVTFGSMSAPSFVTIDLTTVSVTIPALTTSAAIMPALLFTAQLSTLATFTDATTLSQSSADNVMSFTGLTQATLYYLRYRATPASGLTGSGTVYSNWSPVVSASTRYTWPYTAALDSLATTGGQTVYVRTASQGVPPSGYALLELTPPLAHTGTMLYRVTFTRTSSTTVNPVQLYVGTNPTPTINGLIPNIQGTLAVSVQETSTLSGVSATVVSPLTIDVRWTSSYTSTSVTPQVVDWSQPTQPDNTATGLIVLNWQTPTFCATSTGTCPTSQPFEISFASLPLSVLSHNITYGGAGAGLSFQPDLAPFSTATKAVIYRPTGVYTQTIEYSTALIACSSCAFVFWIRTSVTSGSTILYSPYSLPLVYIAPPGLSVITPDRTSFSVPDVTYAGSTGYWDPTAGITSPVYAPLDRVHFAFEPTVTSSGAVVPSTTIPIVHFYFELAALNRDQDTNLYILPFSSKTSVGGVALAYATNYTIKMEVHNSGSGAAAGGGWSGLQLAYFNRYELIGVTTTRLVSLPAVISIPDAPPALTTIVSSDSSQQLSTFGPGSRISFIFSKNTNRPTMVNSADFNRDFSCTPSGVLDGISYALAWASDSSRELRMSIVSVNSGVTGPQPGSFKCTMISTTITAEAVSNGFINSGPSLTNLIDKSGLTATFVGAIYEKNINILQPYYVTVPIPADSVSAPLPITMRSSIAASDGSSNFSPVTIQLTATATGSTFNYPLSSSTKVSTLYIYNFTYSTLVDPALSPLLSRIGYTPLAGYVGLDTLTITIMNGINETALATPLKTESVKMVLSIEAINHAPVFTSSYTLASPLQLEASSNPLDLSSIVDLRDDDDPSRAQPISVWVDAGPSLTAQFTLQTLLSGVSSTADMLVPVHSFRLTGTFQLVLMCLTSVQFTDTAADPDWPSAAYYISFHADDLGSGIAGAASKTADLVVPYVPSGRNWDLTGPTVKSLLFTPDFSTLLFEFTTPIRMLGDTQVSINTLSTGGSNSIPYGVWSPTSNNAKYTCQQIFDAMTLVTIGVGAECSIFPTNTLRVVLGYGSNITTTTSLTFASVTTSTPGLGKAGTAREVTAVRGSYVLSPNISDPNAAPLLPSVFLTGPAVIGACDDLVLRAQVTNTSLHALMFFWSSDSTSWQPAESDMYSNELRVPSGYIWPGATAQRFQLFVQNRFNGQRSAISQLLVSKGFTPIPRVVVLGLASRVVTRGDVVVINLSAHPNTCIHTLSLREQDLAFAWSFLTGSTTLSIDAAQVPPYSRTITIPANLLPIGTHTATCIVSMASMPSWSQTVSVTIQVIASPLQVYIDGGAVRTLNGGDALSLVGNAWDPDWSSPLFSFGWSCAKLYPEKVYNPLEYAAQACYDQIGQSSLTPSVLARSVQAVNTSVSNMTATLNLTAGTLPVGLYVFTATVTKVGRVSGTRNVTVLVVPSSTAPSFSISPSRQVVNPSDAVILSAWMPNLPISSNYSFLWSITPGSAILPAFSDPLLTSGWTTSQLSINLPTNPYRSFNAFPPGATFRLRCTVTNTAGFTATSDSTIVVTRTPSGGAFLVSPATGVSGQTTFTFQARSWYNTHSSASQTNYGMTYKFYVQQDDGTLFGIGRDPGSPVDTDVLMLPSTATAAQTIKLVLRISTGGGVYGLYSTTVTLSPSSTPHLDATYLTQRYFTGQQSQSSDSVSNAYLLQSHLDFGATFRSTGLTTTPSTPSMWPLASSFFGLQARCNMFQSSMLNTDLATSVINTLTISTGSGNTKPTWLQVKGLEWFLTNVPTMMFTQPIQATRMCAALLLASQLANFAHAFTTTMLNNLATQCQNVLASILVATQNPYGNGGRFSLGLASFVGCASGSWPAHEERQLCFGEKLSFIRSMITTSLQMWLKRASLTQSVITAGLTQVNSILNLHRYLFTGSTPYLPSWSGGSSWSSKSAPVFNFPDCLLPITLARERMNRDLSVTFSANDNSTKVIIFGQTNLTSNYVDTRLMAAQFNPYPGGAVPNSFPLLSGVMLITRTMPINSAKIVLPYVNTNCNPVCAACNFTSCLSCNLTCLPTCLVFDTVSWSWGLSPSVSTISKLSGGSTGNAIAECTITGGVATDLTIGVFAGTPAYAGIAWPVVLPGSSSTGVGSTGVDEWSSTGINPDTTSTGGGLATSSTGSATSPSGNVSSSTGVYVAPSKSQAVLVEFTFGVPWQNMSAIESAWKTQLRTDLSLASGVELARIDVRSVEPAGVITRTPASASSSSSSTSVSSSFVSGPSHRSVLLATTEVVTSTEILAKVAVIPSTDPTKVTPETFSQAMTAQVAAGSGTIYSGVVSKYVTNANASTYAVTLCSDNVYKADCGVSAVDTGGGGSSELFGLPLGAGIGIIIGGIVFLGILGFLIFYYIRVSKKPLSASRTPAEREATKQKALEKKKALEREQLALDMKKALQAKKTREKMKKGNASNQNEMNELDTERSSKPATTRRAGGGNSGSSPDDEIVSPSEIELPSIEPQWENAIYVPQHLKKMAAAVTARTAGHEATDANEQEPIHMRSIPPDGHQEAHFHMDQQSGRRSSPPQVDTPDHHVHGDGDVPLSGRRPAPRTADMAARAKRLAPIQPHQTPPSMTHQQQQPVMMHMPTPQQRAAQMEQQHRQQQLRMNAPSAYVTRPLASGVYGVPVAGGVGPQRLPSGRPQPGAGAAAGVNSPNSNSNRPMGGPHPRFGARLTSQQLAQQVMKQQAAHRF